MFEKKKELLSVHPHALRGLHNIFGFDFQQPHDVLYMAGNYTVKKIEKAAAAAGYGEESAIVLLTRSNSRRAWNRDFFRRGNQERKSRNGFFRCSHGKFQLSVDPVRLFL